MDVRERITREAGELFLLMGVKPVKMERIARKLKISKRTIYENFSDKDSLIRATIDLAQNDQLIINNKILNESENIIKTVLTLLKNGSEMLARINPDYFSDLKRLYPNIWTEKIEQNKFHSCKFILELLKKGKQQGLYREDFNEEILASILIEQLSILPDHKLLQGKKYTLVEIYETIIISMTRGIATPKGIALLEKYRKSIEVQQA